MRGPILRLISAAFSLSVIAHNLTGNRTLKIGGGWTAGQIPRINATDTTVLDWVDPSSLGGGTVTSVAFGVNAIGIFTVANPGTTPQITFQSQAANTVLAAPNGAAGAPVARLLVAADIPNLDAGKITSGTIGFGLLPVGTAANTVAAGNDSRFHVQNSDVGTTSTTFQIASGATGPKLKNVGGALEVRNAADSSYADVVVQNLYVRGTQTIVDSQQVNVGDSILTLNADFTGSTPTENGGFEVQRGTLPNASFVWDESSDVFKAGLAGGELRVCRIKEITFTAANLVSGVLTVAHNLGNQYPKWLVADNLNNDLIPPAIYTDANTLTLDFGTATITGTARIVLQG